MKLSLTAWSFPQCTLAECVAISKALGIGALDVGLHYRSGLDRDEILTNPLGVAKKIRALNITTPNYYHQFGEGITGQNLALPGTTAQNVKAIEAVLTFADAANIASVFILPGIINPAQSRDQAADVAADSIKALVEFASHHKAKLCIEPYVQSWSESRTLVQRLIDQTGVSLALDYSHFACLGYRQDEIDPLAKHLVHLRQAKMGALQAKSADGTLNVPAMFATLRDAGYKGYLALETVQQDYVNTLTEDVVSETILMRDCFQNWKG